MNQELREEPQVKHLGAVPGILQVKLTKVSLGHKSTLQVRGIGKDTLAFLRWQENAVPHLLSRTHCSLKVSFQEHPCQHIPISKC